MSKTTGKRSGYRRQVLELFCRSGVLGIVGFTDRYMQQENTVLQINNGITTETGLSWKKMDIQQLIHTTKDIGSVTQSVESSPDMQG